MSVKIASIYPTLLGTYGDGGNVAALTHLATLHGIAVEVTEVSPGHTVPHDADIYVLGGGEDTAQSAAAAALHASGALAEGVKNGASVLAICAGYQILGHTFLDAEGKPSAGLALLDVTTDRLDTRAVGELLAQPSEFAPAGLTEVFTGYENHGGHTHLGPDAKPLATVTHGVGNGDGTEGAISGRVIGTYLHGPCLVRNPRIAERLLGWAVGRDLDHIVEAEVEALRQERLDFVTKK
ncbi:CobQ-like glutamine amidotransferase family enzyme [Aurantimicrobium minutum]|uniref:type 1 glutamine amidotransferase n=1 Tax=Aurantimicrobium minutum TaxID=708131 RepID=UPI0024758A55|nr:glutamine amidotransferase [Aurantimicrobium minutum]MDH6532157.1 CobQ-like glutamine amidotransferase family enzyme [Aurantimicrobium minutum]